MAYNWNTRRSIVIHTQKVEDSREKLKQYLSRNNFNDVAAIDQLMRNLEFESLSHLNAVKVGTTKWTGYIQKRAKKKQGVFSWSTSVSFYLPKYSTSPSLYNYTSRRIVYTVVWFQCCMLMYAAATSTAWSKNEANCVKLLRVLACLFTNYRIVLIIFFFNTYRWCHLRNGDVIMTSLKKCR